MGYTSKDQSDSEPDYQTQSDADTLKKHSEITSDPKRHGKALAHMQNQQIQGQKALDDGHKMLRKKVKHGLKKAFPGVGKNDGVTPFQKAGEGGGTPFEEAEK